MHKRFYNSHLNLPLFIQYCSSHREFSSKQTQNTLQSQTQKCCTAEASILQVVWLVLICFPNLGMTSSTMMQNQWESLYYYQWISGNPLLTEILVRPCLIRLDLSAWIANFCTNLSWKYDPKHLERIWSTLQKIFQGCHWRKSL